jgi:hypothetical protein
VLLVFGLVLLSPLSAETIAIAVRQRSERESAPGLAESVEQGAMELLFGSGHIVFDLDLDPEADLYLYRAISEALIGGASYLVLVDLEFRVSDERGLEPDRLRVTTVDAQTDERLGQESLSAGALEQYEELDAETIADRLGGQAAEVAIESITGGNSEW